MLRHRQRQGELEHQLSAARQRIVALERDIELRTVRETLTGLLTLSAFEWRLDEEVERSRRHGRALTLAVLDVDGFRTICARHGRGIADDVLKTMSSVLRGAMRSTDVAARASAGEFLVMLPETSGADSRVGFERILLKLEETSAGPVESVSVSVGLAGYRHGMSSEELTAAAGAALDRARALGGSRIELHEPETGVPEPEPQRDAITALAMALLERDRYTGEHSDAVVQLAASVCGQLGLGPEEIEAVRTAALLHDIGKVAIPDQILHKPGKLDAEEWTTMREHPVIGERILRTIPGLGGVARIVRHEHERWDGRGYPDGIAGTDIPIGSRVILACDAYQAMTSDRPYRPAMGHAEAVSELVRNGGSQFDPDVTEQLIGCLYGQLQLVGGG
ncbi:MAG TPA: diguanylate cyclase [Thermoleophilaceae bacterium]|nr:diguanylate cyclase [Thermoleophilaceae bacterium]